MPRSYQDPDYLHPLDGKRRNLKIAAIDLEAKDGPTQKAGFTRPFMGGLYDGVACHTYTDTNHRYDSNWKSRFYSPGGCVDRLMRACISKKYLSTTFYAHNGGNFDFLFLLPWLMRNYESMGLVVKIIPAGGNRLLAIDVSTVHNKWGKWRFLDSIRTVPMSLDRAAKAFDVGQKYSTVGGGQIVNAKGRPFTIHEPEDDPGWAAYNGSDCELLYGVMTKVKTMAEEDFGGELGMTAPATAMKTFRRSFMTEKIHRSLDTHEFIRTSYVGGHTEVYGMMGRYLSYFDFNSSYASVMREDMPSGKGQWWNGMPPLPWRKNRVGFCEVVVEVPDMPYPPLPVRVPEGLFSRGSHLEGKLLFPIGMLTGIWEWGELQNAVECGCKIVEWKRSVWYPASPILRQYVERLYRYRDKAHCYECGSTLRPHGEETQWCTGCAMPGYKAGLDAWAKLLLNSLYGKFAMRPERECFYAHNDPEMPEGAQPMVWNDVECPIWVKTEIKDSPFNIPQISARVTALARVALHKAMMAAAGRAVRQCSDCGSKVTFDARQSSQSSQSSQSKQGKQGNQGNRGRSKKTDKADRLVLGRSWGGSGKHGDEDSPYESIDSTCTCCPCGGKLVTEQGRVLYVDTDSLLTNCMMPVGTELGALKDEYPEASGFIRGKFSAAKMYYLEDEPELQKLPKKVLAAMQARNLKYDKPLGKPQPFSVARAKGLGHGKDDKGKRVDNRTAANIERMHQGAMMRIYWQAEQDAAVANGGPEKDMPEHIVRAGTVVDHRLEKLGTLANLLAEDEDGNPLVRDQLYEGAEQYISTPFARGPQVVAVPRRLHIEGTKRAIVNYQTGETRPHRVDMTKPTPQWAVDRRAALERRRAVVEARIPRSKKKGVLLQSSRSRQGKQPNKATTQARA